MSPFHTCTPTGDKSRKHTYTPPNTPTNHKKIYKLVHPRDNKSRKYTLHIGYARDDICRLLVTTSHANTRFTTHPRETENQAHERENAARRRALRLGEPAQHANKHEQLKTHSVDPGTQRKSACSKRTYILIPNCTTTDSA